MNNQRVESINNEFNEIDFEKLFNSIISRKFFIFVFTILITFISIVYVLSLPKLYLTSASFAPPSKSSVTKINKSGFLNENSEDIFGNFLDTLTNQEFQNQVLSDVSPDIEISDIKISYPEFSKNEVFLYKEFNLSSGPQYQISFLSSEPKGASVFLQRLLEKADKKTISAYKTFIELQISHQLTKLNTRIDTLSMIAEKERLHKIAIFEDDANMANILGISGNNFKNQQNSSMLPMSINDYYEIPTWFLWGEKALRQKIKQLKVQTNDYNYIPDLIPLLVEKKILETSKVDMDNVNSMTKISSAITSIKKSNNLLIVSISLILGFFSSIFLALLLNFIKPKESIQ